MPRSRPLVCALFALAIFAAGPLPAVPVKTEHVEAELVSEKTAIVPGEPLTVALRLRMERGWHTYWQNPGDSGLPTKLDWNLPSGVSAGAIQWPAPRALPVGPLVNYGYEGEVLLLTDVTVNSASQIEKPLTLAARADWLVCKETCIPEGADLTLALPVAAPASPDPRWSAPIAATRSALPRALQGWRAAATANGSEVELTLTPLEGTADVGEVRFFPFAEGKIEPSGAQRLTRDGNALKMILPVSSKPAGEFARLAGVLTASKGFGAQSAATIDVPLSGNVSAGVQRPQAAPQPALFAEPAQDEQLSLWVAVVFALLGGVLLNLMPCVFPVLSLKVLGFAEYRERRAMRAHGVAFVAGVIVSFWLLAGVLLVFRAAGQQLGWGFQLQSPTVVAGLATLFFALALNMSGVYEIRRLLPSSLATWSAKNAYVNDALSGALAVIIASPCSAPFMGAAVGYALTETATSTLIIFTALGAGMAAPYLLLALFPAWRSRLPRPGPWMVRLKQLLAFPLYATVLWLAWVLGAQLDNDAVARLGGALLLLAFALWSWQTMSSGGVRAWGIGAVASLVGALFIAWPIVVSPNGASEPAQIKRTSAEIGPWREYAPERVAQLTAAGRAVFVDFTAAWCVTCQVNKRLVLNTEVVQQAFAHANVALLRADWTRRDPVIGEALTALGRHGVPVYVLYRPGKEPVLFPEVLKTGEILDAVAALQ